MGLLQVFDDRQRLGEHVLAIDQRRYRLYSAVRCSPWRRLTKAFSNERPLRFNAIRTRKVAEEAKYPYSFTGALLFRDHRIAQNAHSADVGLDYVTGFHEYRRDPFETHPAGGAGGNNVAGHQFGESA